MTDRTATARYSPNQMARDAAALLKRLLVERDDETHKAKRKALSSRVKAARMIQD